jgi:hypothetical protein
LLFAGLSRTQFAAQPVGSCVPAAPSEMVIVARPSFVWSMNQAPKSRVAHIVCSRWASVRRALLASFMTSGPEVGLWMATCTTILL